MHHCPQPAASYLRGVNEEVRAGAGTSASENDSRVGILQHYSALPRRSYTTPSRA